MITVNGHALHSVSLHVGEVGAWSAECRFVEAPELDARAVLRIGSAELHGTVTESQVFGLALGARIVAGAGGWAKELGRRSYHNDAGIKARTLADDAAREAGETLGRFTPGAERVGAHYTRRVATAAAVLEYAAQGAPWFVDYAGTTHVEARAASIVPSSAYVLTGFDPVERVALLAVDDIAELIPGRLLADDRFPSPLVIRDIEVTSRDGAPLRASVRVGPDPSSAGRLAGLLSSVMQRLAGGELHGVYRYRVVQMRSDLRVDLQAVRAASGLPDLPAIEQCPGMPGLAAELTAGTEVLVSFVDGDPREPLITHYVGPGGASFVPVSVVLGGVDGAPAARQGDSVRVLIPPALFTGTIAVGGVPQPATGIVSWVAPTADGTITGGSGKVRVAS